MDNLDGDETQVIPQDYTAMRVVFRKLGGSWEKLSDGDVQHNQLIVRVIQAWGNAQSKGRKTEVGY